MVQPTLDARLLLPLLTDTCEHLRAVHAAHLEERAQRQLHRGRVAARVGHEPRLLHFLAVQLCQPVDRLLLQLWGPVLASVPARQLALLNALRLQA